MDDSRIINLHEHAALLPQSKRGYNSIDSKIESSGKDYGKPNAQRESTRTLKTFGGVFAPVALCQFSTLLFLRIGFIVGSVGLYAGFGTLCLAYAIILSTVLSISAISTNGAIEGGGLYFMISRILGPEFGGAVGVLFLFANIMGSGLYNIGCIDGLVESFGKDAGSLAIARALPSGPWHIIGYRTALNVFNLCVCLIGAKMFTKTSVFLFSIVVVSVISIVASYVTVDGIIEIQIPSENEVYANLTGDYTGISSATLSENLFPEFTDDYTTDSVVYYATVFSVIYSGLTGVTNGANLSGELINPGFSIPVGTLSAMLFTFSFYCILFVLTAASCSRFLLQNDYNFMVGINLWPPLVTIGMLTATMSSSLSKMIGASRVLEAIVKDKLFGNALNWLSFGTISSNPLGCVFACFLIIQCSIVLGQLNTVAIIATIFFLMSYMSTNIACFCLDWASAPNFRPSFKYFSWWTALMGILGNGCMMFVVSPVYSFIGIMTCLIIIIGLHLGTPVLAGNWGSISQAILYHQVRKFLLMLDSRKDHVKFWRPQILLMVSDPRFCCPLLDFVNDLKKSGLYIIGHVMVEKFTGEGHDPTVKFYPRWQSLVDHLKVKAFIEVTMAPTVRTGVQHLARIAGLGAMKPNTVILGFWDDASCQNFFQSECSPYFVKVEADISGRESRSTRKKREAANALCQWEKWRPTPPKMNQEEYVGIIRDLINMGKNVCLCRHFQFLDKEMLLGRSQSDKHFIDVWPMNFFDLSEVNLESKSSHFALQLATVLNMVPAWKKKTKIRIFLCMNTSEPNVLEQEKAFIFDLLQGLRINATIAVLSLENLNVMRRWSTDEHSSTSSGTNSSSVYPLPETYLKGINLLIRENSFHSAINFMTLPPPPSDPIHYDHYLHALTSITHGLPPTVLVYGLSVVMDSCL